MQGSVIQVWIVYRSKLGGLSEAQHACQIILLQFDTSLVHKR